MEFNAQPLTLLLDSLDADAETSMLEFIDMFPK
jgi:hypothetical protein